MEDIQTEIHAGGRKALPAFAAVFAAYSCIYIARVNMSVAAPELISSGAATVAQAGLLGSIFSIVYAIGRLFSGLVNDRYAPHLVIAAGLVTAALGNIFMSFIPAFPLMIFLWGMNALGQSILWGSVLRTVSGLYEGEELKRHTALIPVTVSVGTIIGFLLDSRLCDSFGPGTAFAIPGILCAVMAAAVLFIIRKVRVKPVKNKPGVSVYRYLGIDDVISKFIPALLHGFIKDNVSFWLPTILALDYMVSGKITGAMIVIVPAVGIVGRLLYPYMLKLAGGEEDKVSVICFAVSALCSVILCFKPASALFAAILFGLIYAFTSMINTTFLSVYPMQFADRGCTATISGLLDFMSYAGASLGSALYGFLAARYGYTPIYICWAAFAIAAILLVISAQAGRLKAKNGGRR